MSLHWIGCLVIRSELLLLSIYPAWPLVDGALLVRKGGALPQTVCSLLCARLVGTETPVDRFSCRRCQVVVNVGATVLVRKFCSVSKPVAES